MKSRVASRGSLLTVTVLSLALAALPAAPAAAESGREIGGLRPTPEIPVRSVGQRHAPPDHPSTPPGKKAPRCDKDVDLTTVISGVTSVATQDNAICTSADIDTYVSGDDTYVVQAGGEQAAWILTNVSTPALPIRIGPYKWSGRGGRGTYTPDVKAFAQGGRDYIALSLERLTSSGFCGVVIVDVTDPNNPEVETQIYKNDPGDFWCDVHNSFVEDVGGSGRYVYLTADARNDMRVVDIQNVESLANPCDIASGCNVEVGRYTSPTASSNNYVHDVTVIDHGGSVGRRAYLAYWNSGLVILDADDVTPGTSPTPLVGPNVIDPAGFLTHHAFASGDGSRVFIQDEFMSTNGQQPVQMWAVDTTGATAPAFIDGITLGSDVPAGPAHNLEINFGLDSDRLYVGWYKMGLQAWDFTPGGFVRPGASPRTAAQYHQAQTEANDDPYDGLWGVRLAQVGSGRYVFQSDRRYGLLIDCAVCP